MISNFIKRTIHFILLSLVPLLSYAQSEDKNESYADSLMQIVNKTKGNEKLEALSNLTDRMELSSKGLLYVNMLEEESIKQKNDRMLGKAYFHRANHNFFVKRKLDSIEVYLNKAKELGFEDTDLKMTRLLIGAYMHSAKYTSALFLLKDILSNGTIPKNSIEEGLIYGELEHVYRELRNYEGAIIAGNKSIEALNQYATTHANFNFESYAESKFNTLWGLIDSYRHTKRFSEAINMTDSVFTLIKQADKEAKDKFHYKGWFLTTAFLKRASTFLDANDLHNARINLDSVKKNQDRIMFDYTRSSYMFTEGVYYRKKGDFNRSLEYINRGFALTDVEKMNTDAVIHVNLTKSESLYGLGKFSDAYELLDDIFQKKDSLDAKYMLSHLSELQTIYEVNQMKSEIEVKTVSLQRTKTIILALSGVLLLLLILFIVTKKNKKEREKRNKKIYEQYQLMKSYLGQIREQRDQLAFSRQKEEEDSVINWAERAHSYLLETEDFKKEDLSRDSLAIALGTNRQYLIDAIKTETGKTFKEYINSIRVEYAYEILITDSTASIESIYIAAGFTTRSTFNRAFKEQYGMSPIEMREASRQREENIVNKVNDIN